MFKVKLQILQAVYKWRHYLGRGGDNRPLLLNYTSPSNINILSAEIEPVNHYSLAELAVSLLNLKRLLNSYNLRR